MSPTAYPLHWPSGWPRTDAARRDRGKFKLTVPQALANVQREIKLLGGSDLVVSSNCSLGNYRPNDPGVAIFFKRREGWDKPWEDVAIPCDRWYTVEANLQAIAKTIEALRGIERWGAKHMVRAAFRGFAALPQKSTMRTWREVLGINGNGIVTRDLINGQFKALANLLHPDKGGSTELMSELNEARANALMEIQS